MNDLYVFNNPWSVQANEKDTSYAAMMALGMPIPETWMVPPKGYAPNPDLKPTLTTYAKLFDLGGIGRQLGYPVFVKPYDGGGWRAVTKCDDEAALKRAYEESGTMVMHLQAGVNGFDRFVRCIGFGPQTYTVLYDPSAPLHDRYTREKDFITKADEEHLRKITLTIDAFFGWEFNSCESLRRDGVWYPIDYANPCPDSQVTSLHYHFPEGAGGNIDVSGGPDGILIVDDQFSPLADKIRTALMGIGNHKLRFILNTHFHGDHRGGNAVFGPEATIVAQSNVRRRLESGGMIQGEKNDPISKDALPVITFDDSLSVHMNGEEIKLLHVPSGHTDGDSIIFFSGANVVHMGDQFFNGGFPFVDLRSGGTVDGYVRNIGTVLEKLKPGVKIIPGHGPLATLEDLRTYHQMLVATTGLVQKKIKDGKTLEQSKAEGLPAEF